MSGTRSICALWVFEFLDASTKNYTHIKNRDPTERKLLIDCQNVSFWLIVSWQMLSKFYERYAVRFSSHYSRRCEFNLSYCRLMPYSNLCTNSNDWSKACYVRIMSACNKQIENRNSNAENDCLPYKTTQSMTVISCNTRSPTEWDYNGKTESSPRVRPWQLSEKFWQKFRFKKMRLSRFARLSCAAKINTHIWKYATWFFSKYE